MYCSCWLVVLFFCFFYWRIGTLPCITATVNTLCSWRKLESHCLVITACVCMFANTLIEDMAPTIVCRSPSSAVAEFKCGEVRVAPGRLMKLNHTYTCTLKTFKKGKSKLFQYTHTQSLIAQAFIKWFDENVNYTALSLNIITIKKICSIYAKEHWSCSASMQLTRLCVFFL